MIYLDHASTTPVKPVALHAIEESPMGNPNSIHSPGFEALKILNKSENLVKDYINGHDGKLVWLNSASLANHFVITNSFKNGMYSPNDFVCMETAHKSIRQLGRTEKMVKPLSSGLVSISDLKKKITSDTRLLSILLVNNETGIIQPVESIQEHLKNSLYHVDAVQAVTKIPIDVKKIGCDFLTMSGHKFGTPKGIACLWIKDNTQISLPYLGTPQVPLIYSFAETLRFTDIQQSQKDVSEKQAYFKTNLKTLATLNNIKFEYNVQTKNSIPNILNIRFLGIDASELMMNLNDKKIYISIGSACNAKKIEPSHVLTSIGVSTEDALSSALAVSPESETR